MLQFTTKNGAMAVGNEKGAGSFFADKVAGV